MKYKFRILLLTILIVIMSTFTTFSASYWTDITSIKYVSKDGNRFVFYPYSNWLTQGTLTIYATPGQHIQLGLHPNYSSGGDEIVYNAGFLDGRDGLFEYWLDDITYQDIDIAYNYTGGTHTITLMKKIPEAYLSSWKHGSGTSAKCWNSGQTICTFIIKQDPASCNHASNTWRYDANNLGIFPFAERFSHSYECST